MSAVFKPVEAGFEALTEARVEAVVAIEQQAYAHPWTRGNFLDSVRSGYQAQMLVADTQVLGYFVAMKGVDEARPFTTILVAKYVCTIRARGTFYRLNR